MDKKIVIVDICGTIYDANTTMTFLDYSFNKDKRYYILRKLTRFFFFRALNHFIFRFFHYDLIRTILIFFLKGKSKKELNELVEQYYNNYLHQRKQIEPYSIIKSYLNDNSYRIVIVSATLDCIASKVAKEMGINEYLSSTLMYKDNICLGKFQTDLLNNKLSELIKCGYKAPYEMTISDNYSDACLMNLSNISYIVSKIDSKEKWKRIINKKNISNYKFIIV